MCWIVHEPYHYPTYLGPSFYSYLPIHLGKRFSNTTHTLISRWITYTYNHTKQKKNIVLRYEGVLIMFLARPGRKQATATKLGIYSTYSQRYWIHFLARCSNFYKPLKKKKFRRLSVQTGFRGSNYFRVGRKMATFHLFFQSREQVVVWGGQIQKIGWVIRTSEAQVGQFLLGCKCLVSRGIVVQEQDSLG